ncbi:hypothetical protein [Bacillus sp. B-jedd]|uniref:hypothetical protein n=1 Tax=Bacillus sp. B-jedd TaxID=1476857 RepID=UPI0005155EC1|nr:hypothetical protein [Bacillus sp. B-jedd]CEG27361.1 YraE protein [Bacillus sp. B-jedd]
MKKTLAMHESLELHEYIVFKNVSLTKSTLIGKLVQDDGLKAILQKDAETGVRHLEALQQFITDRGMQQ